MTIGKMEVFPVIRLVILSTRLLLVKEHLVFSACDERGIDIRFILEMHHLAHAPSVDSPSYQLVRRLLDKGNTWVKLSGAYADTKSGPPEYADRLAVAQGYARAAPERVVWGSDWPHPSEAADKKPNDAVLFDLLAVWVPDEAARHRVLVENPAKLYDFAAG